MHCFLYLGVKDDDCGRLRWTRGGTYIVQSAAAQDPLCRRGYAVPVPHQVPYYRSAVCLWEHGRYLFHVCRVYARAVRRSGARGGFGEVPSDSQKAEDQNDEELRYVECLFGGRCHGGEWF